MEPSHFFPADELTPRLERLRATVAAAGLDGALLHGTSNLLYFAGTAQQAHLWVPVADRPVLLVRRVLERARLDSPLEDVRPFRSMRDLPVTLGPVRRLGLELDILPVSHFERYRKVLPQAEMVDVGPSTRLLRSVKSRLEIARIRAAAATAHATFLEVVDALREGMTELELAIVAEGAERRHGSQGFVRWRSAIGFECPWVHVLAGESALAFSFSDSPFGGEGVSAAAPYGAGSRAIRRGMPVCFDLALARDGYLHDMTRILSLGHLSRQLDEAHEVCRSIHAMFRAEARPGVTAEQLWDRSLAIATEAGLADHFMGWGEHRVRFVGHGLGLELDELPVIAPGQRQELEAGNVIAVEPKMFFPGVGAVGLENTYAIHGDRVETLTVTPDEIAVV